MFNKKFKLLLVTLTFVVLAAFLAGCGMVRVNPEVDNNTIVAKVSGEEVKKEEFNKMFGIFKAQYEQQFGTEVWEQEVDGRKFGDVAREKLLDMLIDEKLQLKKAAELGITVTDDELNSEVEKAKKYFDSEEKFNEFLKGQSMDLEYFRQSVKKELTISKLTDKLTGNLAVTDEELKAYYDTHQNEFLSVKASHILLDTKEEAEKMLVRVKAGENFGELAKQNSKDPSAKENSGDLDYFRHGDMVEPFEKAAFALKPGEISEIVQTDFGFHIIKVEDSKFDKYEDVKEQLKGSMINDKKSGEYEKLLEEMRKNAKIEKFEKNLK
ncbi:MAG TPA: peptidylprolyl isomerase [Patescibacteria group bacterium]|nr:peptidylprolyl isomerase [Patescibacteria group bacterium]